MDKKMLMEVLGSNYSLASKQIVEMVEMLVKQPVFKQEFGALKNKKPSEIIDLLKKEGII